MSHHTHERRSSPYRITLVDSEWRVTRPCATLDHAFGRIDEAEAFVRRDSAGAATFVELIADQLYMVKQLQAPA